MKVDIYIGTPPKQQTVIVDTGSAFMGFSCEPCLKCGKDHINPFFDPKESSSFRYTSCEDLIKKGVNCNCIDNKCHYMHVS